MLKKLRIKNFQSHIRTEIDFCPGVNGIIGASQSGKTSILRAFRLLRINRPLGFRFHSRYVKASKTSVQAIFSNGVNVSVNKSKRGTVFKLKDNSGRKVSFSKMGKVVPDVVSQGINLSDINIHSQLESPFMITSSSGEIAREINKVTNSEMADVWTKNINEKITSFNAQKDVLKADIKSIKSQLLNFKNIDKANNLISKMEEITSKRILKQDSHFLLTEIDNQIKTNKSQICYFEKYSVINTIISQIEAVKKDIKKRENVIVLLDELIREKDKLLILSQEYKRITRKYIDKIRMQKKCPICLNLIKNKEIKRIENEIYSGIRCTRNK